MSCNFVCVVLAALFIAQDAESTLDSLHREENNLKLTIEFLTSYKGELPVKGDAKFVVFLDKEKEMVDEIIEKTRQKIDKKMEDNNNAGGTAQNCKATAEAELQNAKNAVIPQLEKCVQDHKPDWTILQAETAEIITKGQAFRNEIQKIENSCVADPANQENCIGMKSHEVGKGLRLFHATVGEFKGKVGRTTGIALRSASICSEESLRTFKIEQQIAKNKAISCVESAS